VSQGENKSGQRHAFLSYVHEDKERVDKLQEALEAVGVSVWRDTKDLWPGQNWEDQIRGAIKSESLAFIACFSEHTAARTKSFQNAELVLAADEYRLRPPSTEWLLPVRFSECSVPAYDLGAGRTLNSIQRTDLFGESETLQTIRLVQAVKRIVSPEHMSEPPIAPAVATGMAEARKADSPRANQVQEIKALLRDPNGDIALEDRAKEVLKPIRSVLNDPEKFPTSLPISDNPSRTARARYFINQFQEYDKALEPAFQLIQLGAMYGLRRHEPIWTRLVQDLAATAQKRSGETALLELRGYPLVVTTHIASMAAIARDNYGSLRAFVADPEARSTNGKIPVVMEFGPRQVVSEIQWIPSILAIAEDKGVEADDALIEGVLDGRIGKRHTPVSDHIYRLLMPLFEDYVGDEEEYAELFDRAEVFMDLMASDAAAVNPDLYRGWRGGYGRYTWKYMRSRNPPEKVLSAAFEASPDGWSPLLDGAFGGSPDRARAAFADVISSAEAVRQNQW
jgi:hypothetical protein